MDYLKITLRNDFHHTEASTLAKDRYLTPRQVRNLKKRLCPWDDCTCSGPCGDRGEQTVKILTLDDGSALVLDKERSNA